MTDNEKKSDAIERYMDLQRILAAGAENWDIEANNQLKELKVKLESFGVAVENLTIDKYR